MLRNFLLLLIAAYRSFAVFHLGGNCRFEPSCSEYGLQAARLHRPLFAARLIATRICRCRPGGGYGYDPVPFFEMTQMQPVRAHEGNLQQ